MNTAMPVQQRGFSFGGFVFGAFLLVVLAIFGFRLIPAYIENATIHNTLVEIAHDPDMQNATVQAIQTSFDRRAAIDDIKAISGADITVSADGNMPVLSASYSVKVPLGGNVSLLIEFNPSSAN